MNARRGKTIRALMGAMKAPKTKQDQEGDIQALSLVLATVTCAATDTPYSTAGIAAAATDILEFAEERCRRLRTEMN